MLARPHICKVFGPKPQYIHYLWTSIIRPAITYASFVWFGACDKQYVINKLYSLQRLALTLITPIRTKSPGHTLEILYGVMPLDLYIKKLAYTAYFRINPEIDWVPMGVSPEYLGHIRAIQSRLPSSLKDIVVDKIPKKRYWDQNYNIKIGSGITNYSGEYNCYTDGSLLNNKSGCGAFNRYKEEPFACIVERIYGSTVYQAELRAIQLASELVIKQIKPNESVTFHVDNQASLKALNSLDFDQISVINTRNSLIKLGNLAKKVTLTWVRAHNGNCDNEKADEMAKKATLKNKIDCYAPVAMSTIKFKLKVLLTEEWEERWQNLKFHRQSKLFLNTVKFNDWKMLLKYDKNVLGRLVRFVTGHCFLRRHNAIIASGINPPPRDEQIFPQLCRLCGEEDETAIHIIAECNAFCEWRYSTLDEPLLDLFNPGWTVCGLAKFLTNRDIILLEAEDT